MSPALFATPIGLLLIAGAALKLADFVGGGVNSSAWYVPLIVMYEIGLGLGLIFNRRIAGLWLIAYATFFAFAAYNVRALWIGQASCGFFGAVSVAPWTALALDTGVLLALTIWSVFDRNTRSIRRGLSDSSAFLLGSGLASLVWISAVTAIFGSTSVARATLRGDQVFLESPIVDFGSVPANTVSESHLTVHNAGAGEVRVVGGTSNCSCTLIPDLPMTIPSGESRRLLVRLKAPTGVGALEINAVLWTDSVTNETVPVLLRGRSVGP